MKKIGIMGGTFNPIHSGHLSLANKAYNEFKLDKVLFIPSGISYMKKDMNVLDSDNRCELVKLAIEDYPYFELDTIEVLREGNTYTFETLIELHNREEAEYYFIGGADTLFMIEKWREPQQFFNNCTLLTCIRDDYDSLEVEDKIKDLKERFEAKIEVIHTEAIDISSTLIRNNILEGKSISDFVPSKVSDYIIQKGLYKNA